MDKSEVINNERELIEYMNSRYGAEFSMLPIQYPEKYPCIIITFNECCIDHEIVSLTDFNINSCK